MHNKHKIDNIVAMINIDNDGKREQIKISAGYCNECKVYFMLNSTYQALKNKGLILCRITDEKKLSEREIMQNGIRLAKGIYTYAIWIQYITNKWFVSYW